MVEGNVYKFVSIIPVLFNLQSFQQWQNVKSLKNNIGLLFHFTFNEFKIYVEVEAFHIAAWLF